MVKLISEIASLMVELLWIKLKISEVDKCNIHFSWSTCEEAVTRLKDGTRELKLSNSLITSVAGLIKFRLGYVDLMLSISASAAAYTCVTALKPPHVLFLPLWNHTEMAAVHFLFINMLWRSGVKLFLLCLVYSPLLQRPCESFEIQQIQLLVLTEYSTAEQMILTLQLTWHMA